MTTFKRVNGSPDPNEICKLLVESKFDWKLKKVQDAIVKAGFTTHSENLSVLVNKFGDISHLSDDQGHILSPKKVQIGYVDVYNCCGIFRDHIKTEQDINMALTYEYFAHIEFGYTAPPLLWQKKYSGGIDKDYECGTHHLYAKTEKEFIEALRWYAYYESCPKGSQDDYCDSTDQNYVSSAKLTTKDFIDESMTIGKIVYVKSKGKLKMYIDIEKDDYKNIGKVFGIKNPSKLNVKIKCKKYKMKNKRNMYINKPNRWNW